MIENQKINIEQIVADIEKGNSLTQIANKIGTNRTTLWRILKNKNITKQIIVESKFNVIKITSDIRSGKSLTNIANELGTKRQAIYRYLKKHGISKKLVKFDHYYFHSIDTEEKAYWLGFIMADGCVSMTHAKKITIGLADKDASHLEKFKKSVNSCVNLVKNSNLTTTCQLYSKIMCSDLINLGCTPRKSLTLKFPKIKKTLFHHFARGYFDGDGSVSITKKNQLKLTILGTKSFLTSIKKICGITSNVRLHEKNGKISHLEIHGNIKAKTFINWLYKDANIYLERKKEICLA